MTGARPAQAWEIEPLGEAEFSAISRLARDRFGLDLKEGKQELVSARLSKRMRQRGFRSFREYHRFVVGDSTGEALVELIDALATNHTSFFREPAHFDFLSREILPAWRDRQRVEAWSAACSTGEEPYTLAFVVAEQLGPAAAGRVRILATDISTRVLEAARRGLYAADRLSGAPPWVRKHLLAGSGRWEGWRKVKPGVAAMVEFRRLNLIEPAAGLPRFGLILCRNVMIYFNRQTQQGVVERLESALEPGGYLMVGHAESLSGIRHGLEYVRPAVYRRPGPGRPEGRR